MEAPTREDIHQVAREIGTPGEEVDELVDRVLQTLKKHGGLAGYLKGSDYLREDNEINKVLRELLSAGVPY